ncbi:unnamed protein product [Clavelina lepadiformis]|uniref:Uncharacterized protein n=1 Tax=Clavelina lepadiformis TaxID=159417 RepID=A0ABP0FB71_CLALP
MTESHNLAGFKEKLFHFFEKVEKDKLAHIFLHEHGPLEPDGEKEVWRSDQKKWLPSRMSKGSSVLVSPSNSLSLWETWKALNSFWYIFGIRNGDSYLYITGDPTTSKIKLMPGPDLEFINLVQADDHRIFSFFRRSGQSFFQHKHSEKFVGTVAKRNEKIILVHDNPTSWMMEVVPPEEEIPFLPERRREEECDETEVLSKEKIEYELDKAEKGAFN